MKNPGLNRHDSRETWLRAAAEQLRPYFAEVGYPLPPDIRYAIAFTSTGRKGKRRSETWNAASSQDSHYEIFLRADLSEPEEVLAVLVKELVHTAVPADAGHGKQFKDAAVKVGLQGPMREAIPGVLLQRRLAEVATMLGPLPHARLEISDMPLIAVAPAIALNRPKAQRARMLKAECGVDGCPYLVRISAMHVREIGPPSCPKHGSMTVQLPSDHVESETLHEARESV
jgi:hypothetical protein